MTIHERMDVFESDARHGLASSHSFTSLEASTVVPAAAMGMIEILPSGIKSIRADTRSFTAARIARRTSVSVNLHGLRTADSAGRLLPSAFVSLIG
jgi:hypothetical protein